MDLNDFLKNADKDKLSEGLKKAKEYLNTDEGKKIAEKLGIKEVPENISANDIDKTKIMNLAMKNPEIIKKLKDLLKG